MAIRMKKFKEFLREEIAAANAADAEQIENDVSATASQTSSGQNIGEPGNPEEEWKRSFNRDNWYQIWKDSWERLYGKGKFVEDMNKEFEKMIEEMQSLYKKTRGPDGSKKSINDSWQKVTKYFYHYFVQPTIA